MKKSLFLLAAIVGLCVVASAQTFQWAKGYGSTSDDQARGVAVNPTTGDVYISGLFQGTVDFDPGAGTTTATSLGSWDSYLLKLDAIGNFQWVRTWGSSTSDYGQAVTVDASGNPIVTGFFYLTVDFDPGPGITTKTSNGSSDAYVLKFDPSGNFVWVATVGGTNIDKGWSITTDPGGNIIVVGDFEYTVDFDPGPAVANVTANGTISDAFILKLDANGGYVWAKRLGGPWHDLAYDVATNSSSEIIVGGEFEGTADFDPGAGTFNMTTIGYQPDAFVCKLSSAGALVWAKQVGNSPSETTHDLSLDASGNIYSCGWFSSTVDFDPGAGTANMTSIGPGDFYVLKLNSSGNYVWAKQFGGTVGIYGESARGISVNASHVYVTGQFDGTVDMNPGGGTANLTAIGTQDAYVLKLDLNGAYVSAFSMGAASVPTEGYKVLTAGNGNVYYVGSYSGTADFQPGAGVTTLTNLGQRDAYVAKLSTCTATSATTTATACGSYTLGGTTYTASGTYTTRIPNAAGCDSVITLNLTIRQNTSSTINQNVCASSYTLNSQTYTVSGTYTQHLTNSVGCDSAITLNLTLRQPSSSSITLDTCASSFSLNGQSYSSSGTYTQTLVNSVGCDSVLTLNLTLRQPTSSTLNIDTCGTSVTLHGQTCNASGTYTFMLANSAGCDSILTLNLLLRQPTTGSLTDQGCGSYTANGQTYTTSGTYTQHLTNAAGCDSTLTLHLTINAPTSSTVNQSECDLFILNGQMYTSSGTYTQVLTNAAGCDSILTLVLNLGTTPTATITQSGNDLIASPSGLIYVWLDCDNGMAQIPGMNSSTFTPTSSGNYAVFLLDGICGDTSLCTSFMVGVRDVQNAGLALYPNPSSGSFTLKWNDAHDHAVVEVANALGQIVLSQDVSQQRQAQFHLQLSPGVYAVSLRTPEHVGTMRLILTD